MAKEATERELKLRSEVVKLKDCDRRIKALIAEIKQELKAYKPAPKPKVKDVEWLENLWKLEEE